MIVNAVLIARYPITVDVESLDDLDAFFDEFMFKGELKGKLPFNYDVEDCSVVDAEYEPPDKIDYVVKGRKIKCEDGSYKIF